MAASRVLVVGSGVIGLRTAVELVRRKIPVVLRSPKHPLDPSVCSQGAGGLWMPFHCDDPRTDRWALETLDELLVHPKSPLVEQVPTVILRRDHHGPNMGDFLADDYKSGTGANSPLPSWSTDRRLDFQHLTVEMLWWQNRVYQLKMPTQDELSAAGYNHAWLFRPPIVDCPKMLETMLEELQQAADVDVDVETGVEYESVEALVDEAKLLDCTGGVINCTGLGAKRLLPDDPLVAARGILHHYDRKTCVRRSNVDGVNDATILTEDAPWGSEERPCYLIVRGDTIVVGGSYLEGDLEPTIRDEERQQLLQNAELLGIDTQQSKPIGEWTGFRPYRPTSRCELDAQYNGVDNEVRLVHSYGYGGSGWTVYVGCAKEATELILG